MLLAHLGHQAPASVNRPTHSWTHPAGLFWGSWLVRGRAPWHFSQALTQAGLSVQRAALTCRTGCGVNMSPALSGWGQTMPSADCLFINLPGAHLCLSLSELKLNGLSSYNSKRLAQADKSHPESALYLANTESPHTHVYKEEAAFPVLGLAQEAGPGQGPPRGQQKRGFLDTELHSSPAADRHSLILQL